MNQQVSALHMFRRGFWASVLAGLLALSMSAAWAEQPAEKTLPPARFILSFDDGPSDAAEENPTETILDTLASNPTQTGIKAIFFVQTRTDDGGASARGKALPAREHAEDHVLALHSGTSLGHKSHRGLDDEVLEQSMLDGTADLLAAYQ